MALRFSKNTAPYLSTDVLRTIRDMYYQKKHPWEALDISILIRDIDFLTITFQKSDFCHSEHYFDYVRLLIEEIRADESVELLLGMEKQSDKRYVDETTWNELLITALIEDGKNEEAKGKAIDAFFCDVRPVFIDYIQRPVGKKTIIFSTS
ncbi:MAG TPA: hypothetical protein ACHBX0_14270 [Arsenophonus sp.]